MPDPPVPGARRLKAISSMVDTCLGPEFERRIVICEGPAAQADSWDAADGALGLFPLGVATLDGRGRVLSANRALCRALGYGDLLEDGELAVLVHPDDLGLLRPPPPDVSVGRRVRLRRADGCYRRYAMSVGARRDADEAFEIFACLAAPVDGQDADTRLQDLLDASPDGFAVFHARRDGRGRIAGITIEIVNESGRSGLSPSRDSPIDRDVRQVLAGPRGRRTYAMLRRALGEPRRSGRATLDLWDGPRTYDLHSVRLDPDSLAVTWRDVTEAVDAEQLLQRAYEETAEMRATLQTALDATSDGFAVYALECDPAGEVAELRVLHANAAGAESLGYESDEIVDRTMHEIFPGVENSGLWERIVRAARTGAPQQHRVHEFDESGQWVDSWDNSIAPVGQERMAIYWRNVSAEESALRQLARHRDEAMHSATHDALTGLPNRVLLREHLQAALINCRPDQRVGIVFVDLDRFKSINDTYGHAAGDIVLCATAERLSGMVRQGDLAARLAGDEFVLVLTGLSAVWTQDDFFARAAAILSEPLTVDDVVLHPRASLGVVLADPASRPEDVDTLIKAADARMYVAKAASRDEPIDRPGGTGGTDGAEGAA